MRLKLPGVRIGRNAKRGPLSFGAKVSVAVILALSFVVIWSSLSPPASSAISSRRDSFDDIESEPFTKFPATKKKKPTNKISPPPPSPPPPVEEKNSNDESTDTGSLVQEADNSKKNSVEEEKRKKEEVEPEVEEKKEDDNGMEEDPTDTDTDLEDGVDVNPVEDEEDSSSNTNNSKKKRRKNKKVKNLGPLFDPKAEYEWKLCPGKNKHNYIPCIDTEAGGTSHRHRERTCPRRPVTCLVPLQEGYASPVPWPERQYKIVYRNVAHPMLSAYIKTRSWLNLSGEYLMFPQEESDFKGGVRHYLDSIEEMVPDIEWGKNVRVVLDIGCTDASFGATLLEKDAMTLSLGLMNEQTDLAQLALERGFPAVVSSLGTRRLPFPSGVFDAIHCSDCNIAWHSSGGKLLLEMNRVLRPGGYFIISTAHGDIDREEGMSSLTASICWNILAHKTDEVSELSAKIYQKPTSNDIYGLRRRKEPPLCKEDDNQDTAWYTPIKTCLHKLPAAIEQRGTDWPEEWPKRLETYPEWLGDLQEKVTADDKHWKAIVTKSYLNGMGIDWSNIRSIMDMKAIYGGFAAALVSQKVWVMNVVPVHAPNTLPIIYERGLLGMYHDWCEPFSTYPRSYDLLHADHLFSRLKNRCQHPIVIVVEMDRILRPGGWAIIREKLEILNSLETIFRTLHWEIRMTFAKDKEGIICVQKTTWRPPPA